MMKKIELEQLINLLDLKPLEHEGGLYKQTYGSNLVYLSSDRLVDEEPVRHPLSTAIYYLLTDGADSFSALHKLPTDEVYHFYLGDPVEQLRLHPDGYGEIVVLGQDILSGQQVQTVVPAGVWQGSRLAAGGKYALLGTTMSPGFIPEDYMPGERAALTVLYPDWQPLITVLTRLP